MQNIIKALRYKTVRDNVTYYSFIGAVILLALEYSEINGLLNLTASEFFLSSHIYPLAISVIMVILGTRICGWDYEDKTMNYELLIGHSRKEVYWSRVWVSFTWCMPAALIILIVPPLFLGIMNGWGIYMDMGGMIFRCVLSVFTIFRMFCECVLLTFLTKSCYIGLIVSFLFIEIGSTIPMFFELFGGIKVGNFIVLHSMANFRDLITLTKYSYQYVNGNDEILYDTAVDPTLAVLTITVSLAVGIGCLILGYLYFRKSDMK